MKTMLKFSFSYLATWMMVAVVTGFFGAAFVYGLRKGILLLHTVLFSYVSPYAGPVIGGLLMVFLFRKMTEESLGMGTDVYIHSINKKWGDFDIRLPFVKLFATISTIGFNGSGGLVGPSLLIGSSFSNTMLKTTRLKRFFKKENARTFSICGAAAALGALFEIPISGGILAVEILNPVSIFYDDLFPAIMASTSGYIYMVEIFGVEPLFNLPDYDFQIYDITGILLTSIAGGILGLFFVVGFQGMQRYFKKRKFVRLENFIPLMGSVFTVLTALVFGEGVLSNASIQELLLHDNTLLKGIKLLIGKGIATIFTVALGNSGGVIGPALFMGAALGNIMSHFFDIIPCALAAAGISAATASISNIPIAAIVMMLEIFGDQYITPAVIGGVVGFLIGRPRVVYDYLR